MEASSSVNCGGPAVNGITPAGCASDSPAGPSQVSVDSSIAVCEESSDSRPDQDEGAAPGDTRVPRTFVKGFTYLGRSYRKIRDKERCLSSDGPATSRLTRDWKPKGWESLPKRVENLLWIKKNTFYKEVLDDCKEQKKEYDAKIKAIKKSQGEVSNEIYNLLGFFSVFQGVILTAVTQLAQASSKLLCGKVWFPVALSVVSALIAAAGITSKYKQLYSHEKDIHANRDFQTILRRREDALKEKGENFFFGGETQSERDLKQQEEDRISPLPTSWVKKSILVSVLVFLLTAVFIVSYFVILCDKWVIKGW